MSESCWVGWALKRWGVLCGLCPHLGQLSAYLVGLIFARKLFRKVLCPDLSWASVDLVFRGRVFSESLILGAGILRTGLGPCRLIVFSTDFVCMDFSPSQ